MCGCILARLCLHAPPSVLACHPAVKISTGSQALDELLGGGVETKAVRQAAAACACPGRLLREHLSCAAASPAAAALQITEVFGEWRTGKTQLALTMCVTSQIGTEKGGGWWALAALAGRWVARLAEPCYSVRHRPQTASLQRPSTQRLELCRCRRGGRRRQGGLHRHRGLLQARQIDAPPWVRHT